MLAYKPVDAIGVFCEPFYQEYLIHCRTQDGEQPHCYPGVRTTSPQAHMSRMLISRITRAGVSGLTTAYLLSQDASNSITVLAKHMPGDYDIEYTSPWAGANYLPYVLQG